MSSIRTATNNTAIPLNSSSLVPQANSSTLGDPAPKRIAVGEEGSTRVPAAGAKAASDLVSPSLLAQLPNFIQKRLAEFLAATPAGVKNLTETERRLYYLLRHGIEAAKLETIQPPTDDEDSKKAYQKSVNEARNPALSARTAITAGFTSKIALYLEEKCGISPQEFHDIMGRDFFLARDKNQTNNALMPPEEGLGFNLDYARHIAEAFDLAEFKPGNTTQNIQALLTIDLTKDLPKFKPDELKRHFDNQKRTVEAFRKCEKTGATELDFLKLDDELEAQRIYALPPHIGKLGHLTKLSLGFNQLASLPVEIGLLVKLTELHLAFNQLASLPAEIGLLVNLTKLALGRNRLTTLPAVIGQLKNLTWLSLFSNQLTTLPAEIGQLVNLTKLTLGGNKLTALPVEIGLLVKLTELWLYNNQLIMDEALGRLFKALESKEPKCMIYR